MTTITHIAEPGDDRCRWWQAVLPKNIDVKHLTEKIEMEYQKKGKDLELDPGTLLIDSEEKHHRKKMGYEVLLGLADPRENKIKWLALSMKTKMYLKETGNHDLMQGSGDVAAVFRAAIWLQRQEDLLKSWDKLVSIENS